MTLALGAAALVWLSLVAYGVFGGADFGAGIWDLLAIGDTAERQRNAISRAMGPVWEANNVWLIYVIVGSFTAFPIVFSTISTALSIPLTLALIGIVMRGSAFIFRAHGAHADGHIDPWEWIFSAASVITPFLLGMCAAAIAGGQIRVHNDVVQADFWRTWTTPFAFACGAFALGICACLAATYLTVEAVDAQDAVLTEIFRWRAILSGAVTAVIGAFALVMSSGDAPILWHGLIHRALPVTLLAMAVGLVTAAALLLRRFHLARMMLMIEIALILVAWAVAQAPALIVPDVTIDNAASPAASLQGFLIASAFGMLFFLPSLWFLFSVFKGQNPAAREKTASEQ